MYKIKEAKLLTTNIYEMVVEAPRVAKKCLPGQFLIVRAFEDSERIPLTICDYDREAGTVTIVFQTVGGSTKLMSGLKTGDSFHDVVGPLGKASELCDESIDDLKKKKILFVAGGVGTAPVYPQVRWLHENGVDADVIVGSKTKDLLILEDEMKKVTSNLYICTDDGSYGTKGFVTDKLKELIEAGNNYDEVIAIGPVIMMKFISKLTEAYGIKTIVSLNPIMIDGTGMCGGCRVTVDGKIKYACVDGPDFDGHKVDFDELMKRNSAYREIESEHICRLTGGKRHG